MLPRRMPQAMNNVFRGVEAGSNSIEVARMAGGVPRMHRVRAQIGELQQPRVGGRGEQRYFREIPDFAPAGALLLNP